jgi:hypothetical protein
LRKSGLEHCQRIVALCSDILRKMVGWQGLEPWTNALKGL